MTLSHLVYNELVSTRIVPLSDSHDELVLHANRSLQMCDYSSNVCVSVFTETRHYIYPPP